MDLCACVNTRSCTAQRLLAGSQPRTAHRFPRSPTVTNNLTIFIVVMISKHHSMLCILATCRTEIYMNTTINFTRVRECVSDANMLVMLTCQWRKWAWLAGRGHCMESRSEFETVNKYQQLDNSWLMDIWWMATCGNGLQHSSKYNIHQECYVYALVCLSICVLA